MTQERIAASLADRYRLEGEIGSGGMATVYLAHDVRHDRKVALKVLSPELAAVMGAERFLTEIRTTANLQHPHILPLFDSGEAGGLLFYVMPFIDGESLQGRLDREKQLPVEEAIAITVKVAGALQAAHDKGVVHRDIKPANILLANGEPLVADFGIALAVQHAGAGRLTETGLSLGTPYYMSPEQATADRDPDARSDVYSLACVLYEMLAGEPPFQGSTAQAVLGRILTQSPTPITQVRPSVPAHVEAVLAKSLQKLPADRIETASDLAAALVDPAKAAILAPAPDGGRAAGSAARGTAATLGRVAPWGIAAAALVVAAVAARGPREAPTPEPLRFSLGDTPITPGYGRTMSISPDGRTVVFEGRSPGGSMLFRRSLGSTEVVPLDQTEGGTNPEISPDGRWVAFSHADGDVRRVSIDGGSPTTIATFPNPPIGLSWASDERLILGMLLYNSEHRGLQSLEAGSAAATTLTMEGPYEGGPFDMHHEPYVLPGGTHALALEWLAGTFGLSRVALSDGETVRLDLRGAAIHSRSSIAGVVDDVFLYLGAGGSLQAVRWDPDELEPVGDAVTVPGVPPGLDEAVVAPDGTLALRFSAESYRLAVLDDRGLADEVIAETWFDFGSPRFSPDGSKLAVVGGTNGDQEEVWVYDMRGGVLTQLSLGFEPFALAWSPDGRRVFAAEPRFEPDSVETVLWSRAADASDEPVSHLVVPELVQALSFAPDGVTLAMARDTEGRFSVDRFDVEVLTLDGGGRTTFAGGDAAELAPRFSPDGRWLAYSSNESGRPEVYVRPFPGPGARVQVSAQGGWQPLWSRDGDRIFYRVGAAVMAADLDLDPSGGAFSVARRQHLFEGDFRGGPGTAGATWDVHPDGRRFVFAQGVGGVTGRIIVWRDWLHEVERLLEAAGS